MKLICFATAVFNPVTSGSKVQCIGQAILSRQCAKSPGAPRDFFFQDNCWKEQVLPKNVQSSSKVKKFLDNHCVRLRYSVFFN